MQRGKHLVINLENTIPNFKRDYDCEELPLTKMIFNPEMLYKRSEYMKLVKVSENYDVTGQYPDMYEMHKDFMIVILTNAGDTDFDDGMVQMALDVLPN